MDFKQAFEKELEDIYLGKIKDIKGDGGYINLIKIKSQFYNDILKAIKLYEKKCIPSDNPEYTGNDHEDYLKLIYEHIFTFFSKYLNDTGTPFYSKIKSHNGTYAPVYKDDDVSLFWKTQDLYYIKSEKLFDEMSFEIGDVTYQFNVDELKRQTANEKLTYKFLIDINDITSYQDNRDWTCYNFIIKVMSNKSDKALFENLYDLSSKGGLADFKKAYLKINKFYDENELLEALRKYQKQSDIDYFIHKNAKIFLEEQLDLYMYNAIGRDMITDFKAETVNRYRDIRILASMIVDCIAKFENELKCIWEKPKFVKNSNYIITLDKLSSELIKKIKKEKPNTQKEEWIELSFIDDRWKWGNISEEPYKTLPIDTKHLSSNLKYEILASFDNLDECIDGVLIKSDNYQALQTLQAKYQEKIDLIYIDPPFNTGEDFAYKDGFQDSTWLTLMENRLELAKTLLSDQGSFYLHLDDNADYLGRQILDLHFGHENYRNNIIWTYNGKGLANVSNKFIPYYGNIFLYSKNILNFKLLNKNEGIAESVLKRFGKIMDENMQVTFKILKEKNEQAEYEKSYKRFVTKNNCEPLDTDIAIDFLENGTFIKDIWTDIPIIRNNPNYTESYSFNTQKPEALLERIIKASSNHNSMIMDYFSGSGTTINTAHKLGRKWIGIEMGDHFHTVILPRVKNTLYGIISGISKELQKNIALKIGGFVKYYELESYDEVLNCSEYKQWDSLEETLIWDEKLSKALVFNSDNTIAFDFSKIGESYQNFADEHSKYSDIAETLSNLFGAEIIKIDHNKLTLKDVGDFDMDNLNFADEKVTYLKKLIWWESL